MAATFFGLSTPSPHLQSWYLPAGLTYAREVNFVQKSTLYRVTNVLTSTCRTFKFALELFHLRHYLFLDDLSLARHLFTLQQVTQLTDAGTFAF